MKCIGKGCARKQHAHGMCLAHYLRWYKHGDARIDVPIERHRSRPPTLIDNKDGTMLVPLTQGCFAIIDAEDAPLIVPYIWMRHDQGYAYHDRIRLMHRYILGLTDPTIDVDHINGLPFDNRRCNLRIATRSQNNAAIAWRKSNTSGYKGVQRCREKWKAIVSVNGRPKHLGVFDTPEQAARKYDEAARELFGEFAVTNADLNIYDKNARAKHKRELERRVKE